MPPRFRGSFLEVRSSIIKHNALALKEIAGDGFFCPMVKANAYGHGLQTVVRALTEVGVSRLGVATLDEALELKDLGFLKEILVFSRIHNKEAASLLVEEGLVGVVSRMEDLELLDQVALPKSKRASVHLKFDTGIHRMGFSERQVDEVLKSLQSLKGVELKGLLTHLSHGEDAGQKEGKTQRQIDAFLTLSKKFSDHSVHIHCLNSVGMLARSKNFSDVSILGCRPGVGLYGGVKDERLSVYPALRVVSQVDHLQNIKKGDGASYGWKWLARKDSLIGVVPFGYGDGYPRSLGNKAFVLVGGKRAPVVGAVCMDYILVDLSEHDEVHISDEVVILGEQGEDVITPMELAVWGDTISYEILTSLGLKKNRVEVR